MLVVPAYTAQERTVFPTAEVILPRRSAGKVWRGQMLENMAI
jgi:hypothetical protein